MFEDRVVPTGIHWQDNLENATTGWTLAGSVGKADGPSILWHLSETNSSSATHAWYYGTESNGKAGSYGTSYLKRDHNCPDPDPDDGYVPVCYTTVPTANWGTLTSPPINLAGLSRASLVFAEWSQLEPDPRYDRTMVEISTDGSRFKQVFESHGTNNAWATRGVDLSAYAGKIIYVRFHFDTVNAANNFYRGWYIDDVAVYSDRVLTVSDAQVTEGNSGSTNAAFTVKLSAANTQPVTVQYTTGGGTATAGSDYQIISGLLTFAPGEISKVINVPVLGDTIDEPNESFFLNLSNATNILIADGQGLGTITDDDAPPNLLYSTFLGGSGTDQGVIAVDSAGNMFLAGITGSANFPITTGSPFQGQWNVYVTKLNANGTLAWSRLLNGSNGAQATGMTVDAAGNVYVTGITSSPDFPTTEGAYQITYTGPSQVGFVTKLDSATGALIYSTYLGLSQAHPRGIAVDAGGYAYVVGETVDVLFPTTDGAYDRTINGRDAFVTKINRDGSALVYSTLLGGNDAPSRDIDRGGGIVVDSLGNAWVTGTTESSTFPIVGGFQTAQQGYHDPFLAKLNADGTALLYSTYFSASTDPNTEDFISGIAVDAAGSAYLTGQTSWTAFPTTSGSFQTTYGGGMYDGFVAKIDPTKSGAASLAYASYVGGSGVDWAGDLVVDAAGVVWFVGNTRSTNFPTASIWDRVPYGSFVAGLDLTKPGAAALVYTSDLVGVGEDVDFLAGVGGAYALAMDGTGNLYVSGSTRTTDLAVTPGAFDMTANGNEDTFAMKLTPDPTVIIDNVTLTEGNAGTVNATFTGSLSAPTTKTVSVNWATADGTAKFSSNDYLSASGTLTFLPGETTKLITITVNGDTVNEANETFFVNLGSVTNALIGSRGMGMIINDDAVPTMSISIAQPRKSEGNSGTTAFIFTVTLSAPSEHPATVNYRTTPGTATAGNDYQAQFGTLTFNPGETTKTVTILVYGDKTKELDEETFTVDLSEVWNAIFASDSAEGMITNDD